MAKKPTTIKTVESLKHDEATRKNIPTAEYQSVMQKNEQSPVRVAYERGAARLDDAKQRRRNRDLDPQLVWCGKDEQDWSDLVVHAPPLHIQEKVHPKVLIDDLLKQTREQRAQEIGAQIDLFAHLRKIWKVSAFWSTQAMQPVRAEGLAPCMDHCSVNHFSVRAERNAGVGEYGKLQDIRKPSVL